MPLNVLRPHWGRQALLAAFLAAGLSACGEEQQEAKQQGVPVSVTQVETSSIEEVVNSVATLEASQRVGIRPQVSATLIETHFTDGEIVEKGDQLFTLDSRKLSSQRMGAQASITAAKARLRDARQQFERIRVLRKRGVSTNAQFDQAQADMRSAEAELERLKAELSLIDDRLQDTRITAPFTGSISAAEVDTGNYVQTGDSLATLYATDPLKAQFAVPERYMNRLEEGLPVRATVVAFPGRQFEGEVTYVSPGINPQTRKLSLEALIENPGGDLRPGAFGTIALVLEEHENIPVIPEEALIATRAGYMVFVIEEGKARARPVETGLRRPGLVEITDGLEAGERIVRAGHINVTDGTPVRAVDGAEPEEQQKTSKNDEVAKDS